MALKIETATVRLAMYRDAVNGATVFLENPVYGYYRVSSVATVNFDILDKVSRIEAENATLREKLSTQTEQFVELKKHLGQTGE